MVAFYEHCRSTRQTPVVCFRILEVFRHSDKPNVLVVTWADSHWFYYNYNNNYYYYYFYFYFYFYFYYYYYYDDTTPAAETFRFVRKDPVFSDE